MIAPASQGSQKMFRRRCRLCRRERVAYPPAESSTYVALKNTYLSLVHFATFRGTRRTKTCLPFFVRHPKLPICDMDRAVLPVTLRVSSPAPGSPEYLPIYDNVHDVDRTAIGVDPPEVYEAWFAGWASQEARLLKRKRNGNNQD